MEKDIKPTCYDVLGLKHPSEYGFFTPFLGESITMANTNLSILGFYVPIGSNDYAKSSNYDQPFGYDVVDNVLTGPVFAKTLFDIENAFQFPVTLSKRFSADILPQNAIAGLNDFISRLIYQKEILPTNVVDTIPLPGNKEYEDLMNVVELIEFLWAKSDKNNNTLTAEEISSLNSTAQKVYGSAGAGTGWATNIGMHHYSGELDSGNKWGKHRYSFVEIRNVPLGSENNASNPQLYDFKVYFNPDAFYENEIDLLNKRVKVFYYEDKDGDPIINPTEWSEKIINEQHRIFTDIRYKNKPAWISTRYFAYWDPSIKSGGDNVWPNSTLIPGPDQSYDRQFFVYSLFEPKPGQTGGNNTEFPKQYFEGIKYYIKNYLTSEKRKEGNKTLSRFNLLELQKMYPDLFLSSDLAIFFVKSGDSYMHPISLDKMRAVLIKEGFTTSAYNFNRAEIITIGTENDPVNVLDEPMTAVAVNQRSESEDGPISDMFNYFVPIFENETNFPSDANEMRQEQVRDFHKGMRIAALTIKNGEIPPGALEDDGRVVGTNWVRNFIYAGNTVSFNFSATMVGGENAGSLAGVSVLVKSVDVG